MKNTSKFALFVALLTVVLSCGIADRFTGGDLGLQRSSALWPDVPRIDELNVSEMEMPLAIKVIMRTVLNNLWRLNEKNEDQTPSTGDWIAFTTPKTPADLASFYNNDRMTSFGSWEASQKSTCLDGKENGIDGGICVFQKIANGKDIKLAIISMKDEERKQTNVFFIRIERPARPGPANTSNTTPQPTKSKPGPITALSGTAPYGIESRPMPTGTDLETLLPKRVGSYERVMLEQSESRGTTADAISVDGNGVYATYRNGNKELFVEFSVASSAEYAQSSWDVVVGDANEGIYPTDPRVASFRTEPSYLKVVSDNGAFFAWTRGGYFITAHAKGGEADLDAFMNGFPY
jgi:hypothetical protein